MRPNTTVRSSEEICDTLQLPYLVVALHLLQVSRARSWDEKHNMNVKQGRVRIN